MDFPGFQLDTGAIKQAREPDPEMTYDLLILGGGPASMCAAIYAARKMLEIAIITRDLGGQMLETSDVENWIGYKRVSAKELVSDFTDHVKSFDVPIKHDVSIRRVEKENGLFIVSTDKGKTYKGKTMIYALGMRHRPLDIPGEKEFVGQGVAYCATCDAPFFKKKKTVIAGGGNSAFTTALDLSKVEAQITMINFVKGWQADEALVERIKKYEKAALLDNHQLVKIEGDQKVQAVLAKDRETGEEKKIETDGVFVEIGLLSNTEPIKHMVSMNQRGEIEVDCSCKTSVEGLFAAGDVTNVPYKQIVIAAGEGAKAALSAYQHLVDRNLT